MMQRARSLHGVRKSPHHECKYLDSAGNRHVLRELLRLEREALSFAHAHNEMLPRRCPACDASDHVAGLQCVRCRYVHPAALVLAHTTEWGYRVCAVSPGRPVVAIFEIPQEGPS